MDETSILKISTNTAAVFKEISFSFKPEFASLFLNNNILSQTYSKFE